LALLVWKKRVKYYWQFVTAYIITSFTAFAVFLLYPAAPPWLASNNGYIPQIARVSSFVYAAMGITDSPSVYNSFAPNPVAAVPSLHAAYSTLFALFVFKLFGKKWGLVSLIYPALIFFGVVYMGEHYVFDLVTGCALAFAAFYAAPYVLRPVQRWLNNLYRFIRARVRLTA
jgi:membrane-associated phospholipid phosphatase